MRRPLVRGDRLIVYLFLALAAATVVSLLVLAQEARPEYRERVYYALIGNLVLAAGAYFALRAIGRRRKV